MDLMTAIDAIPGIGPFLPYITLAVFIGAAMAPFFPPPVTGGNAAYAVLYGVVNWLAINKLHAKNATAPTKPAA